MFLGDLKIRELITEHQLVQDYVSLEKQLQPCGFECTVGTVYTLENDMGVLDFDNSKRYLPNRKQKEWDNKNTVVLQKGFYLLETNEFLKMPNDLVGFINPRSSLHRMGLFLREALIDPGFKGTLIVGLVIFSRVQLYKDARILQISFAKVTDVSLSYDGIYKTV
ncbi:MAG: 2'-deoxycytidine 5'-triphosphate deaminase [Candidatus Lokiarchaeota archaeon]|nr:2'-deoxycytidine 5'-triphosphate deaminase [Candidatus Lokiarchaeota archaeon]